jgi:hypothetical protein
MTQLHTIVARQRGVAARTRDELSQLYRQAQHAPTFMGGTKEFVSKNDEDVPNEPPETALPSMTAQQLFRRVEKLLTEAWDAMSTRDRSNMDASADIVVDGETLAQDVPLTTLLSLEKQLADLRAVFGGMPVLDPSKPWAYDEAQGFAKTPETRKPRTRKVVKGAVLHEGTEKHAPQVQAYNHDEVIGHTVTVEFSGAISPQDKENLLDRTNRLIDAVKAARTVANQTEVTDFRPANRLLGYIFAR